MSVDACSFLGSPCGTGLCINDGFGDYNCLCPVAFTDGLTSVGGATCVPSSGEFESIIGNALKLYCSGPLGQKGKSD